jgi:hypothetical protein
MTTQSYTAPGPTDGRLKQSIGTWSFNKNDRIRAVIAWNACTTNPAASPPPSGLPVLPDFDLFLFSPTTNSYVYASQSVSATTEGFDIDIPVTGTYDLRVAWSRAGTWGSLQTPRADGGICAAKRFATTLAFRSPGTASTSTG